MNVSIGAFSFYNLLNEGKMDIFGYLETVKYRYALDAVDLWNGFFADRSEFVWKLADDDYIRKIKEALDEKRLTVANFAVDRAHAWDPDPERRRLLYENALAHLRAAEILGAKTVRIDACYRDTDVVDEEQFEYIVACYRDFARRAADGGYVVGPENHMGASLHPGWMKRLAEAVNHPSFGILLHIGRWREDKEVGDAIVAPWVCHAHFDAKSVATEGAVHTIKTLTDAGFSGYCAVEYNPPANHYIEVEWALSSMKRLLASAAQ